MVEPVLIFIALVYFLYLIAMAILYILFSNLKDRRYLRKKDEYQKVESKGILELLNELKNSKENTKEIRDSIEIIRIKMKKRYFRAILRETLEEYNEKNHGNSEVPRLMGNYEAHIQEFISKYKGGKRKSDTYIIYLLGVYRVDKPYINKFLIEVMLSDSLYLKTNALLALSCIGDMESFLEGIERFSKGVRNINRIVLEGILNRFTGNREGLFESFLDRFSTYNLELKISVVEILSYFRNEEGGDLFLELLNDESLEIELKLAILRYFTRVKVYNSKEYILKLMESNFFEVRATAVRALRNFKSKEVIKVLLEGIQDNNWYVRFNSANTLLDFKLGEELLREVEGLGDSYAKDSIYYAMFERNEIDYEEYILKVHKMNNIVERGEFT